MTETYLDFWDEATLASLTPAQMEFVRVYVETDDRVEAAKKAWPDDQNPASRSLGALKSERIRAAIAFARAKIIEYVGMNRAAIVSELEAMARFNPKDYIGADGRPKRMADLSDREAKALGDVEFSILPDGTVVIGASKTKKMDALKTLAKATGMLDKGSSDPAAVYHFDLSFAAETPANGVKVNAGGVIIDIKTTDG